MQSLEEAKSWLRDQVDDGARCPCCTQHAKVYKRALYASIARELMLLWRETGTNFGHWPTIHGTARKSLRLGAQGTALPKAAYWALIEDSDVPREDGGRAGWWRVTAKGDAFCRGQITVPKYARVYDGRCLGLIGEPIGIHEALGEKFNYEELMAA